jgi:hypothetical protein
MGTVVLNGTTSGSTTLSPTDAVTATLTLPNATSTLLASATAIATPISGTPTSSNYLRGDGTWASITSSPTIVRSARTSNTILGTADVSTLINITSGTFSQTLTAATTLGSGWFCYIQNSGTGFVTLDPNGSETITRYGVAYTTWILWPQETCLLVCDGTGFFYTNLQKGTIIQTISSSVSSLAFSTGMAYRKKMRLSWSRVAFDASTQVKLYLNTSTLPDKNSSVTVNGTSVGGSGAGGTGDNFTLGTATDSASSGSDLMRGYYDFMLDQNTASSFGVQQYKATTPQMYGLVALLWNGINESTITNITIVPGSPNNLTGGIFTLAEL